MTNRCLRRIALVLFCALVFSQQGCVEKREETLKNILAYDPSFQSVLDKRNSLQEKLNSQKTSLLRKEMEIGEGIIALKEKKALAKEEYASSVENIKRQMQPEKRRLKQDLLEINRRHRLKRVELSGIERDISEINSLIKKKDKLALTQEEMQTWNKRLSLLLKKKVFLESEVKKLKKEGEITKLKIGVLDLN
jgi:hypothetical protein